MIECPICKETKIQYRSKNNQTLITKYKCLSCNHIFKIKESDIINDYII